MTREGQLKPPIDTRKKALAKEEKEKAKEREEIIKHVNDHFRKVLPHLVFPSCEIKDSKGKVITDLRKGVIDAVVAFMLSGDKNIDGFIKELGERLRELNVAEGKKKFDLGKYVDLIKMVARQAIDGYWVGRSGENITEEERKNFDGTPSEDAPAVNEPRRDALGFVEDWRDLVAGDSDKKGNENK